MSKLSFEEQVIIFMKTSHFVTTEGAHMTNIIFMNKDAKIAGFNAAARKSGGFRLHLAAYALRLNAAMKAIIILDHMHLT